jgi:hypothetical protein
MDEPPRTTRNQGVWWLVGILLLIPMVMPLMVPIYAKENPKLFDFPFFFWYQFMWIPIAAALTFTAFKIVQRQERRDREAGDR